MSLNATLGLLSLSADTGRRRRADFELSTRAQAAWLCMRGPRILWRAANQLGKSRAQAKKLVHFIRRTGAYRNRRPGPVRILVVSISKEQMWPLHEKIWEMLPKDEIDAKVDFVPGYGFRGKPPRVLFASGPGKGSLITFATYEQGAQRVEGGTYDVVLLDEPTPREMWGVVQARVLHGDPGEVWITFTRTPQSPDIEYLKKEVKEGRVVEMPDKFRALTLDNVRLSNGRTILTQAQIDKFTEGCLELEAEMRLRGGWDLVATERALMRWGVHCLCARRPPAGAWLVIGIDHGSGEGKQAAVLLAVVGRHSEAPRVYLLGESVAEGYTSIEDDADAIARMIWRAGLRYDDIDAWVGDRETTENKLKVKKSNAMLRNALAVRLGREAEDMMQIETVYKCNGSVDNGVRLMNAIMGRREPRANPDDPPESHWKTNPECTRFATAAAGWNFDPTDPLKDVLDGGRYALERAIDPDEDIHYVARLP